jgi:arylsulfatase A-like enzyme
MNIANHILCLILICSHSIATKAQQAKPNIIYILADDLGYGDVSCMNEQSKIKTTHIDKLATAGMRFTDAHSNSSVCTPTRYGIMTGRYAWRSKLSNGVTWSYDSSLIVGGRKTVATMLKQQGYATACIGKWHLGLDWGKDSSGNIDLFKPIKRGPTTMGFDYFFGITASLDIPPYVYIRNDRITASLIDTIEAAVGKSFWRKGPIGNDFKHEEVMPKCIEASIEFIEEQAKKEKPFFLYLPLPAPHTPILPTATYKGKTGANDYGDFVLMMDDMVGKIIDAVKKAGIEENTMIVFTSDNGCSPSANFKELEQAGHSPSYEYRGAKADIYEGGHRIPFIVKWPNQVRPNSVSDKTISLTDFFATITDLMDQDNDDNTGEDSYSILPLLTGDKKMYKRKDVVHHSIDGSFAIRKGKWKLEFCSGSGGWSYPTPEETESHTLPPVQLYNMKSDISEHHNISTSRPLVVKKLTALMQQQIDNGRSNPGKHQQNDLPIKLLR